MFTVKLHKYKTVHVKQRVLNDLWMAFLRPYDLAARPPPPLSSFSKLDRRHTGRLKKRDNLPTREGGGRVWAKSQIIGSQRSLVLY
jgi:hypothetical protein